MCGVHDLVLDRMSCVHILRLVENTGILTHCFWSEGCGETRMLWRRSVVSVKGRCRVAEVILTASI